MNDIKKSPVVLATRDYGKFKTILGNRIPNIFHVNELVKKIGVHNLLHGFVGVVTKDDYLIDGQHRLAAAEANNLWFYYIKLEEKVDDIIVAIVNSSQKAWTFDDYINFFAVRGNKQYLFLQELKKQYGISFSNLIVLSKGNQRNPQSLKKGILTLYSSEEEKGFVIDRIEAFFSLKEFIERAVYADREFVSAIRIMFESVSAPEIIEAVQKANVPVALQSTIKDYLRTFESILNRGKQEKNYIRFF